MQRNYTLLALLPQLMNSHGINELSRKKSDVGITYWKQLQFT
jgi:hypothetical protein